MRILNRILLKYIKPRLIDSLDERRPDKPKAGIATNNFLTHPGGGATGLFLYGMLSHPLRKNKKGNDMKKNIEHNDLRAPNEFKFNVYPKDLNDHDGDDCTLKSPENDFIIRVICEIRVSRN